MQPEDHTVDPLISETQSSSLRISRRSFLEKATATTLVAGIPAELTPQKTAQASHSSSTGATNFLDLLRFPDRVTAYLRLTDPLPLNRSQSEWHDEGIVIESKVGAGELAINVHAPGVAVRYVHLRWDASVDTGMHTLGDHWE